VVSVTFLTKAKIYDRPSADSMPSWLFLPYQYLLALRRCGDRPISLPKRTKFFSAFVIAGSTMRIVVYSRRLNLFDCMMD
jgi:hypothetical protein